ncbi:hypothetical protein OBBRIDRAFT_832829 [Obba rivulosa]|uniref:Uncharacterized protein n=1 Tax=Obba rivulosa TaxID=1052685 RepID=A0A8E2DM24_9APHY|nr:hypothetical protein OBBRIDRAFT_832829 [Obba rivulosa]
MSTPETVYVNQLFPLKHGLPVWNPDPDVEGEVRIGDVGYMHRGTFCRVFNAMSDPTDPDNAECRLPQDFVKLDIPDKLKFYNPRAIHAGAVCSKSVQALKLSGELKAGDVLQGDFSITCMAEQGAALLLDDDAERKEIKPNRRMPKYMADHIQRWLDLINEIGLDIAAEDIYFVRGFVKSRTWATMTFQNASHETSGSVKFDYGPVGISLLGSWNNESSIPPLTRSGPLRPQANSSAFAITDGSSNTEISAPNGWPRDQCIFLNYYKVKMRRFFGPKVIKAAAGPSNLPSEETKRESRQAMSIMRDDESMVGDIVEEGDSSKFHDPVDYILDYILECAPEADLAVASDADISILCEDSAFSNDVAQLLRDRTPYIKLEANSELEHRSRRPVENAYL